MSKLERKPSNNLTITPSNHPTIPSPCYLLHLDRLKANLTRLRFMEQRAEVSIIFAIKAFSLWRVFPLIGQYLRGATASSLYEARLIKEEMSVQAHTYAPVYHPAEFAKILQYSSHLTFNSLSQYEQYKTQVIDNKKVTFGIRVNPEWSPIATTTHNPTAVGSRLGVTASALENGLPKGIEGIHFHVLAESSAVDLATALTALEDKFARALQDAKWINLGGGHALTRPDYDIDYLVQILNRFRKKYKVAIILEPGHAVVAGAGDLHTTILDIVDNHGIQTAVLDISFQAHLPDVLDFPYLPTIKNAVTHPIANGYAYRLGGTSCLANDYVGMYYFKAPLKIGQRLVISDTLSYTLVKTTMFNGVSHPSIGAMDEKGNFELIRQFNYEDYKERLS